MNRRVFYVVRTRGERYAEVNDHRNYVADVSRDRASPLTREEAYKLAGYDDAFRVVRVTCTTTRRAKAKDAAPRQAPDRGEDQRRIPPTILPGTNFDGASPIRDEDGISIAQPAPRSQA